jgi:uncharacterized repeat protein (TIGR03847 family)
MSGSYELGRILHISAEAIGQPGQRRFRLRAIAPDGQSASLWLEKEQVNALADAIDSVLTDQGYEYRMRPLDDLEPEPVFPLNPSIDMHLAQLSMGVNRDTNAVVLIATDGSEPGEADSTTVTLEFDFRQAFEFRRQAKDVVAAGRPPCPLCIGPMDPEGHVCVRSNGHNPH